ncbi:MAG: DMSO/TMAO reductase YedYZ molybdopterin-dependent catalytic subunit [Pirellulaceae bacterium]|jgi:DMSO/TMAO reductase YedYZ molybdopterin-dependent catalytic subunit
MATLLKIIGLVGQPLELTLEDFRRVAPAYQVEDMSLIDARRLGRAVELDALLAQAQLSAAATRLKLIGSADGYESVIPLGPVRGRGLIIYEVAGTPLSSQDGGPTRFYIRDYSECHVTELDGCANVKYLDTIEVLSDA